MSFCDSCARASVLAAPKTTEIKESIVLSFEKFNSLNEAVIEPGEYKEDLKKLYEQSFQKPWYKLEEHQDRHSE